MSHSPDRDGPDIHLIIYGPDPSNKRRSGGVASCVRQQYQVAGTMGLPVTLVYTDRFNVPGWLTLVDRILAAILAAGKILSFKSGETVVHANTSLYVKALLRDWPFLAACKIKGIPVLLQIHGGRLSDLASTWYGRIVLKNTLQLATLIGVFPGPQYNEFIQHGFEELIRPIYNMVTVTGERSGDVDRDISILFLGRLTPEKGVEVFLEAFEETLNKHSGVRAIVAGDGKLKDLVQKVSRRLGSGTLNYVGYVTGMDKERVLTEASVFVLPSLHEGFPISFLECAERGMTCLVTDNSAIPSAFEENVDFIPIKADGSDLIEKIDMVISDVNLRERVADSGQAAVRTSCSPEAIGNQNLKLYHELIAK